MTTPSETIVSEFFEEQADDKICFEQNNLILRTLFILMQRYQNYLPEITIFVNEISTYIDNTKSIIKRAKLLDDVQHNSENKETTDDC